MSWLMAIILGFIQGVTEFIPVSSSGHLAIFQAFGLENIHDRHLFFDVLLHMGTLVAVCVVYRRDMIEMWRAFSSLIMPSKRNQNVSPEKGRLAFLLVVATLPLILVFPFRHMIEQLGNRLWFVGLMLLITGGILFFSDRLVPGRRTEKNMTLGSAIVIGLSQCLAALPGISRSGTTIATGMMGGLDRGFSVRFSFLLSVPAIFLANIVTLFSSLSTVDWSLMPRYLVGVVVAGITGFFAIHLVKLLVERGRFGKFAYYCWGIGIIAIVSSIFI